MISFCKFGFVILNGIICVCVFRVLNFNFVYLISIIFNLFLHLLRVSK